jgi:FkbM family methyltransferase
MFSWSKKFRPVVNNDFAWSNYTSFYDSENKVVDVATIEHSENIVVYDEHRSLIDKTQEYPEQCLSYKYINPESTVLELGARYGSVSCVINKKLQDKTKQVSVEPDPSVWQALENNIQANGCSIHLHKGFVSKTPRALIHNGYATRTIPSENSYLTSSSVEYLQEKHGLTFDTLVADCEGFLETFFDEHPFLYEQLHTVIFEADFPNKCNYDKIRSQLKQHGFRELIHGFQNVYKK